MNIDERRKMVTKILEKTCPVITGNRRMVYEDSDHPMTVKELKKALEQYDENKYVVFNHCNAHLLGDESFKTHIVNHTVTKNENYVLLIGTIR